jgi:hypothetical protein
MVVSQVRFDNQTRMAAFDKCHNVSDPAAAGPDILRRCPQSLSSETPRKAFVDEARSLGWLHR